MLNKVMLIGNVGKDPEVRYLDGNGAGSANGNSKVATFPLATTERFRDRNGETRENTEWHNIVAWRNLADLAEKYIRKGSQLYVEGRLRTRSWTDQTGAKRFTTEIVCDNIQLLGRKSDNPGSDGAYSAPSYAPSQQVAPQTAAQPARPKIQEPINVEIADDSSDDLPF